MSGYAIKRGTVGGRLVQSAAECAADEVFYAGQWVTEPDGFRPAMVWDGGIDNVRLRTTAEALEAAKAQRIAQINAECRQRLVEQYGDALEQGTRWGGGYGEDAQAAIRVGVPATLAASNFASAAVNAATTVAEVEAVTVTWPTLP